VLAGEVNAAGKATGYHAEGAAEGAARIQPGGNITQYPNGTYAAPVQIWSESSKQWIDKDRLSTFFPAGWSRARIEFEVTQAFKGKVMLDAAKWQGTSPSGIMIQGFTTPSRTTFYPLGKP
jgi:filamentous hemagglutinin